MRSFDKLRCVRGVSWRVRGASWRERGASWCVYGACVCDACLGFFFYFIIIFFLILQGNTKARNAAVQYKTTTRRRTGETAHRRNEAKTRRYRDLQSATKKKHFPHLQCSRAKYHQIQFGGAKPDDLHDTLSFLTKAHFQTFTMLPYAKGSLWP